MDRNFYLWSKSALSIGCVEMKKLRTALLDSHGIGNGDEFLSNEEIIEIILASKYIDEKTKEKFRSRRYSKDYLVEEISQLNRRNIGFITIEDELYPENLSQIYDPPYLLYYLGDIDVLKNKMMMAVVGSRKASEYGIFATKLIVKELAARGMVIVSGMATGIDSYAHKYCMEAGRPTIAVFGTGIDKVYPKKNLKLRNEIIERGGLIISEYGYDSVTKPSNFAFRNRIISGMSMGVLVTEAQKKSGTMITVDTALQEGKNVYAVPGSIFSSLSRGCNKLIIDGAKPVCDAEDILVDFGDLPIVEDINKDKKIEKNEKNIGKKYKNTSNSTCVCDNILTDGVKTDSNSNKLDLILSLLKTNGAMDVDHIQYMTGYDVALIISSLNKLYIMGQVVELGNNTYALAGV